MQAAFDVAPTWDGRAHDVILLALARACEWVCVCAGGAECPLLSKQRECLCAHLSPPPPTLTGCGLAGDLI